MNTQTVAVLGAGTMGHGIAQVAAASGFDVFLYDLKAEAARAGMENIRRNLQKAVEKGKMAEGEAQAALGRLRATDSLEEAVSGADLVIEAAPESLALKQDIFRKIAVLTPKHAVLATNTSSLSVADIASATPFPERVLGMHFFNPPYILTLLELVLAPKTSVETAEAARAASLRMGREVVTVKDSPGFATSRLGVAIALEAMRMLEEGVASAEDIDRAMELGYRHPMGPLRLTDHVGLDTRLAIAEYLHEKLSAPRFEPPAVLRRLVSEGKLGKKSGEGFYRY